MRESVIGETWDDYNSWKERTDIGQQLTTVSVTFPAILIVDHADEYPLGHIPGEKQGSPSPFHLGG